MMQRNDIFLNNANKCQKKEQMLTHPLFFLSIMIILFTLTFCLRKCFIILLTFFVFLYSQ